MQHPESPKYQQNKRAAIRAAAAVFARKGFHGASTTDIAGEMGIKQGSLYYYFKSKEEALAEVCLYGIRDYVQRMEEIAGRIIGRIGYDNCPFNMEFFLEPGTGDLHVLEMNSRLSQSHSDLFYKVDGQPHEVLAVELALGRTPRWRRGAGRFELAAKCFVRRWEDGLVRRVPGEAQLAALHEEQPETLVELKVTEGQRLSELPEQEEYSYELADLFIGARDEAELLRKKDRAEAILDFEIG